MFFTTLIDKQMQDWVFRLGFTLNDVGEIGSQDHAMVTKILYFIHKLEVGKVIFFNFFIPIDPRAPSKFMEGQQ